MTENELEVRRKLKKLSDNWFQIRFACWKLCCESQKLGQLYLQNGKSDDLQILSTDWIDKATTMQIYPGGDYYGYLWWLTESGYLALGFGGQIFSVFPDQQLVIGSHSYTYSNNNHFSNLMDIIFSMIFPIFDISSNSFNHHLSNENIKNIYKSLNFENLN